MHRTGCQGPDRTGGGPLGEIETPEEDRLALPHDPSRPLQPAHRVFYDLLGEVEASPACIGQLGDPGEDVALAGMLLQQVFKSSLGTEGRMLIDPHLPGDPVRGDEPDPSHILGQTIGVLPHDPDRVLTVGPVDAGRVGGTDAVALEEQHHVAYLALLRPGPFDARDPARPDAGRFGEAFRLLLYDLQGLLAKAVHQAPGKHRADAPDKA